MGKKKEEKKNGIGGLVLLIIIVVAGATYGGTKTIPHHKGKGSSAQGVTVTVQANASELRWVDDLLTSLGDPRTAANKDSLVHWITRESVGWPPECCTPRVVTNNPMNTTLPEPDSTQPNGLVWAYPSLTVGLHATVATLENGRYPDILSQLHDGSGLLSGASAGLLTWSQNAYSSV